MTHWRVTFMLILNHEAAHEVSCATSFSRANLMHEHRTSPRQSPCAQCFSEATLVWAGLFLAYAVAQRASTRHLWCTQRFPQETWACTKFALGNPGDHRPSPRQQFLMCIHGLPRIKPAADQQRLQQACRSHCGMFLVCTDGLPHTCIVLRIPHQKCVNNQVLARTRGFS